MEFQSAAADPVGTWNVSTTDERGVVATATLTVTGHPGAYHGEIRTSKGESAPVVDVMTSPSALIFLFRFPGDRLLVTRLVRDADGDFSGVWGEVTATYPITAERGH